MQMGMVNFMFQGNEHSGSKPQVFAIKTMSDHTHDLFLTTIETMKKEVELFFKKNKTSKFFISCGSENYSLPSFYCNINRIYLENVSSRPIVDVLRCI